MHFHNKAKHQTRRPLIVKVSRSSIYCNTRSIPDLKFEDQQLTSFAGLVVFNVVFRKLGFVRHMKQISSHIRSKCVYGTHTIIHVLVLHVLLGYRRLQELDAYREDPMVLRVLGLKRLPDVSVISRALRVMDSRVVAGMRAYVRNRVLERIRSSGVKRITLDFDGSVQSTRRSAEGTAVGYNKKRKGDRSYYPLLCMIAQTGQVFDVLFRSGNVHDSNGSLDFIYQCLTEVRTALPKVTLEARLDSAFFNENLIQLFEEMGVEYSISVPFERFTELKAFIEKRRRWKLVGKGQYGFELKWKPKKWTYRSRFLVVRNTVASRQSGPLQLDLFRPLEEKYEYKVIVTNKKQKMRSVIRYHEGRGSQEGGIGELKNQAAMDYVPVRKWAGNQVYLLCGILAHNLNREVQMEEAAPARVRSEKRSALWVFEKLGTARRRWIQRAGRLSRPQGKLTLTMANVGIMKSRILNLVAAWA